MLKDGTWIVDVCAESVCADPKIILPQIGLLAAFDGRRSGLGSAACDLKQNYSTAKSITMGPCCKHHITESENFDSWVYS